VPSPRETRRRLQECGCCARSFWSAFARRGSQAGGNSSDDHLVEDRRAVMGPERQRPGKHHPSERCDQRQRTRQQGCCCRGDVSHRRARVRSAKSIGPYHIGLLAAADNRSNQPADTGRNAREPSPSTPSGDGGPSPAALGKPHKIPRDSLADAAQDSPFLVEISGVPAQRRPRNQEKGPPPRPPRHPAESAIL
jgi:hypothetical protein